MVSNEGRDFFLLLPIIYFLEKFGGYTVEFEFVWRADLIRKHHPDLVILPNTRGHQLYYEIASYCKQQNISCFSHDSEGNFNTDPTYDYWGYNLSRQPISYPTLTWNERVKNFLINQYQLSPTSVIVTGAPGFDKYKYLQGPDKQGFLKKYNKESFSFIIGYAGWAFGKLENREIDDVLNTIQKPGDEGRNWLKTQRDKVEDCLKQAIVSFPDILFILKKHPRENFESDLRDSRNEMNRLKNFPNVLYLKDEEDIQDLIYHSNVWLAFESTSIMEAWLLDKPTLLINPDENFARVDLHKGSVKVRNSIELIEIIQNCIDGDYSALYNKEVLAKRDQLIANSIGFSDGLNHLRSIKAFENNKTVPLKTEQLEKKSSFILKYRLLQIGRVFYIPWLFKRLPKFKKTVWIFENESLDQVKKMKIKYYPSLDSFYHKQGIAAKIKDASIWSEL